MREIQIEVAVLKTKPIIKNLVNNSEQNRPIDEKILAKIKEE